MPKSSFQITYRQSLDYIEFIAACTLRANLSLYFIIREWEKETGKENFFWDEQVSGLGT